MLLTTKQKQKYTSSDFDSINKYFIDYVNNTSNPFVAIDLETNGLDCFNNYILLCSLSTPNKSVVYDCTDINVLNHLTSILNYLNSNVTWLGHNIKFDYQFLKVKLNITLKKVYDTMIVFQKLFQGFKRSASLKDIAISLLKNTNEFIKEKEDYREYFMNWTFKNDFTHNQVLYAMSDTEILFKLKEMYSHFIKRYKMEYLINNIHNPLVIIIAELELRGIKLDEELVKKIYNENLEKIFELECKLDNELRTLRDTLLTKSDSIYLKGGRFDYIRKKPKKIENLDLFGEIVNNSKLPTKAGKSIEYINWNSSEQLLYILTALKEPVPTKSFEEVVPKFTKDFKIDKSIYDFTTEEKSLAEYLLKYPETPVKTLFNLLFEYREYQTEVERFGLNLIEKINIHTNAIHTKIIQAGSENGRFRSGGGKKEPNKINSQNIPRKEHFRRMFKARENYSMLTIDLAGAEVTIMSSKAQDTKLFELAMKGDIHSYLAQLGWRNIFKARKEEAKINNDIEEYSKNNILSNTFIVNKTTNSHIRQACKNLTFGSFYKVGAKKAGKTINVKQEEGQIYIDTIENEFPKTIEMINKNIEFAVGKYDKYGNLLKQGKGYIVLNEKTNSRKWFPEIIDSIKKDEKLSFANRVNCSNQAANIPISGTQADMIQEAMVLIDKYHKDNNIDAHILMQVHDELVIEFNDKYLEFYAEKIKQILCDTCNTYLTNIKMDADYHIAKYWKK